MFLRIVRGFNHLLACGVLALGVAAPLISQRCWAATAKSAGARATSPAHRVVTAPVHAATVHPCADCEIHVVTRGEGLGTIAREYLDRTSYMTIPGLESAIRRTNGWTQKTYFRPGEKVLLPGVLGTPIVAHPIPVPKTFEARGIYLTAWMAGSERGLDLIRRWREAGGNAVAFDIKDVEGRVAMPFSNPLAPKDENPPIRDLPKFVHFLHAHGIHAIARIALFKDAYLAQHDPQLDPRSRQTGQLWRDKGQVVWVDPSLPAVQDYNLALAKAVARSGVDEIQFDYVRFPTSGDEDDAEFSFEAAHPNWQRSRVINAFLKRAYAELHPMGVLVSLDVFGVAAWEQKVDLAHTGQDIPQMARYCDVLSPMIYPSHFFGFDGIAVPGDAPEHFIGESMKRFRQVTAASGVVLRPWLQAFAWRTPDYSPQYVTEEVSVARQEGGIGFLLWNAGNNYTQALTAMAIMRAAGNKYFRGDELPERPAAPAGKLRSAASGGACNPGEATY